MDSVLDIATELFKQIPLTREVLAFIPTVYFKYLRFLPILGIGIASGLVLTPLVGHLAEKLKIFDYPAHERKSRNRDDDPHRHIHTKRVPFLGGIAVLLPVILAAVLFVHSWDILMPIIFSLIVLIVLGILDDKYNLPAKYQLIVHVLIAFIIAISAIDLKFINNPFNGVFHLDLWTHSFKFLGLNGSICLPGDLIVIPWIILCINAVKWVGGIDGLMESNVIIAFLLLFVLGVRNQSLVIIVLSLIAAGSLTGFLYFNFPPAKIFTGATGKTAYGFLLATLAIVDGAKMATSIIILALPILDAIVVIASRVINYKPKSLFELLRINDKSHLHHQLMALGLRARQILLIEVSLSLFFGLIAVFTTGASKFFALLVVPFIILVGISTIHIINLRKKNKGSKKEKTASPESKYSY